MKKLLNLKRRFLPLASLAGISMCSYGQDSGWIAGLYTHSNHAILGTALDLATLYANVPLSRVTHGASTSDQDFVHIRYMSMTDNGETVDYKIANPYGFTLYDLFNNLEAGLKFGWQGAESPIGAYVYCAYGLDQYKLRFLGEREYNKHVIQSLKTGIRVRISPFVKMMEDYDWCPIIELGTTYVHNFKYKGPNDNDVNQINDGTRTYYAVGANINGRYDVLLCCDLAHYDLFNRNYTPDGGFWYPYANFKNKDMNFSLRFNIRLGSD